MAGLLVSVKDVAEAKIVLQTSVEILDVKDPSVGALGAAKPSTLKPIVEMAVGTGKATSFSAGELVDWLEKSADGKITDEIRQPLTDIYFPKLLESVDHVKLGLAGTLKLNSWKSTWAKLFADLPDSVNRVAVCYLDYQRCFAPEPKEIIQLATETKACSIVLFDTFFKQGNLFDTISASHLKGYINQCHQTGLGTVIAGSVDLNCLNDVLALKPKFVGVRGAVCQQGRMSTIELARIQMLQSQLNIDKQLVTNDSLK